MCTCGCSPFPIYKVDNPYLVNSLNWTPTFEWYVVGYGFKNGYQKDMCLGEIGLHAHVMITILCSKVNRIGGGDPR